MKLAFIGTGLMGQRMAIRLLNAGHELAVYNRHRDKAEPLAAGGARVCDSPREALEGAAAAIAMLTDAGALRALLLDAATCPALSGVTVIQMATIAPQQSRDLLHDIQASGGDYFECPVLGSLPEAEQGALILMAGCTREQFERWQPVLTCFGPAPRLIGPVGHAAAIKLALNQLIASLTAAFSLSLGFVQREGLDTGIFMDILRQSALYAPTFDKKLDKMLNRDFSRPNFPVQHLLKDVDLFLREARALGLNTVALEGVRPLIEEAMRKATEAEDYSALFRSVNPE